MTDRFNLNMDEFTMRNCWIELDVKARLVGGIDKLYPEHQTLYVKLGLSTGFLSEEEGQELARELGITLR